MAVEKGSTMGHTHGTITSRSKKRPFPIYAIDRPGCVSWLFGCCPCAHACVDVDGPVHARLSADVDPATLGWWSGHKCASFDCLALCTRLGRSGRDKGASDWLR